jgi:hypothetical protein
MDIESLKALQRPFGSFGAQNMGEHCGFVVSRVRLAGISPDQLWPTCGHADFNPLARAPERASRAVYRQILGTTGAQTSIMLG